MSYCDMLFANLGAKVSLKIDLKFQSNLRICDINRPIRNTEFNDYNYIASENLSCLHRFEVAYEVFC